jgi:transposase-like protein
MSRGQKFKAEEIIAKLREAEVDLARGKVPEVCKQIGVTEQTYYRWKGWKKKEYSGLRTDQAKRLKELEKENTRLMRLLANVELDVLCPADIGISSGGPDFSARREMSTCKQTS